MNGNHSAPMPDCELQSGGVKRARHADFCACFANDNKARPEIGRIAAIVLCLEFEQGIPKAAIRARMPDGGMILLATSRDPDDFVALWRGLGRDLNAPLEVLDRNGTLRALTLAPGKQSFARWRGSSIARRRTRFARRRIPPMVPFRPRTSLAEETG